MIIAVDGPTASGKGTISKALAAHYGLPFLSPLVCSTIQPYARKKPVASPAGFLFTRQCAPR
jgi:cytidylate kinase